jgi:phospholipid/cholesterol/gamma-HCH transport system ATP-binding protein
VLLNEIIGLVKPDAGSIHVLGESINHLAPWAARVLRRRWGVLF